MVVQDLSFGSITIDGIKYEKDLVIDKGLICKRKKGESKKYRDIYGHTPLSAEENIPWDCRRLIIGTGHSSSLPVMKEVLDIAGIRGIQLINLSTPEAVKYINDPDTNFVLHLTC